MTREFHSHSGADPRLAGGRLTIDISALTANYRLLSRLSGGARTAGVVKANAYGLGVEVVVPALLAAGCEDFFVALPEEGLAVRRLAPDARIFVLTGLFEAEAAPFYSNAALIPVLNTERDIAIWEAHCGVEGRPLACAIHVDTGMNRLGLTAERVIAYARENALTRALEPVLLMSHFACADESMHPLNGRQIATFQRVRAAFPGVEASMANSAGIFLGEAARFDLTRPGIALYGGEPVAGPAKPIRPVVTAEARVAQIRHVKAGESASYGAAAMLRRDTRIAVAAVGYADGYHRAGSGAGVPLRSAVPQGAHGFVAGQRVPVLGRVTMDLTLFDVTDCGPDAVQPGDHIELFGPNIPIDEAAHAAGTIAYELLTSLGQRWQRHVIGAVG
ncbi:MAG: alanine racemase [Rhizobiaceae bacterium]